MADGKFKIAGSTTGNYYVMKNGKRTYFDAHNKPMDENVFLKAENATIDRNNSMRKKEHVDAKSNLVKQYYPGSKTGRYYTVNPKTGQKTYYASNGNPIKESYCYKKEQEAVEAVKNKGKSKGTEKTEKKGFWGKLWDHAKSFGKGVVKSVTKAFTDENGKFSWKQTLKTIGTAAAVTVGAALLVGAEILTAGQVTWLIVGAGVAMGGTTIAKGAINYANANTYEEKLKATEEMGEGTGEIGQAILFKKGIKGQMSNAAAVGRTAKMEALASGSGRYVASLKGAGAGLKSMVPSPKQMLEGTKNGAKTVYDTVRHPVRTTKNIIEARRAKSWEKADIQEHISGAKTHEDIAAARKQVNESEVLSAKQKAKYNKQLDKAAESATHEDLAALRKNATETAANPSAKKSEITKAQKEYENGVKRSTDREALENAQNEGLSEFEGMKKADFEAKIQTAKSGTSAENDALFTAIKKSNLEPKVKTKLLKDLKAKGAKQSSTSVAIEKRIVELDKLQETEFNGLINKAEFKKGSWASRQIKRIRGKKGEYETIEARIKAEVKNPEIREQLLTKLKNKKQLLEDINNLKKHPKKDEYEKLIERAKDEVSLDLIEKKLANDHHIIKSRTSKPDRSDLYRQIFAKKHSINPEKYPNIAAKLEEKRLDSELKEANSNLAKAKRELNRLESERDAASAEIDANKAKSRSNTNEVINSNGRIEELKGQISKLESEVKELNSAKAENVANRAKEIDARQGAIEEMDNQSAVAEGYRGQEAEFSSQARLLRQKQEKLNTLNDEVSTLNKDVASARSQRVKEFEAHRTESENVLTQREIAEGYSAQEEILQAHLRPAKKLLSRNKQELNELSTQNKKYGIDINKLAKKYAEQMKKDGRYKFMSEEQRLNVAREYILDGKATFNGKKIVFSDSRGVKYPKQSIQDKRSVQAFKQNIERINELKAENARIETLVERKGLETDIATLKNRIEVAKQDLAEAQANRTQHGENIKELTEQIRANEAKLKAKEAEVERLGGKNKDYDSQIKDAEFEQKIAKGRAEQAEQDLAVAKQERAQHGQEIQRLNREIRDTETSIKAKETELQKARSEQGENSQRVQELQNEIKEIRRGLPEKQAKLKELQEKYTTAEKNVKNLETAQRTAKRKVENNQKALEEVAAKKPKRGWGAIPTMIVATENVAHTADTLQTGVEALMALAAEDAQEEQQVTEDEQVAETEQETGDDVEQIGDAPEDEATATDETTSDTSTDTSTDSSTSVSDSATPATGTPSNAPVNAGNSSTTKVEDKKAEDKKVDDKTNTPTTEEKKEEKPVTAEEPTVDNDDNNSVNDITIKTYINGRDESGELRDITPAERLILTEQIQNAKNIDDVALIYSEMRSFNKFDGRRNLRRALKQKRKEIEGKHNNYYARMQRVNNDNATLNVTEADRLLAKTNESSTENLSNMSTVKKKFGMFRSPEYLLKSDNADIGILNQGTPITDSPVVNETNLFAPTDALAKENAAAPETTSEASLNVETTSISVEPSVKNASDATSVEPSVENASDVTSVEPSVAQVKEETTASQTDMAQADIPDDEVKHKLDIDNGWGDLA